MTSPSPSTTPVRPRGSIPISPKTPLSAQIPTSSPYAPAQRLNTPRQHSTLSASSDQRKARRAELRQFYGLKDGQPSTPPAQGGVGRGSGSGNGSGNERRKGKKTKFDSEGYYDELVGRASLVELIKAASSLSVDIAELQGERHALVYNHHHQLFAAGDTISHLNSRTPQLQGIMSDLQQSFSEISRLVEAVSLPPHSSSPNLVSPQPAENANGGRVAWKRGVERLRLMVLAEEPPDKIRLAFTVTQGELNNAAEIDEEARSAMQECQQLIRELPPIIIRPEEDVDGVEKEKTT